MKKIVMTICVLMLATAAFAQSPFADVPTDHWAYDAVNSLQQSGIVIGYPDGTFGGKRAMSRYEFATAIARMIPIIEEKLNVTPTAGVSQEQFNKLENRVSTLEKMKSPVTAEQFQSLQSLVNEFRDELAAIGVDTDALKRDVAALAARVDTLEKKVNKVTFDWNALLGLSATTVTNGAPVDIDNRPFQPVGPATGSLINSLTSVRDMDLLVAGNPGPNFMAVADINFGNYLPIYLNGVVTDYSDTIRPTANGGDAFTPYYMYAKAGFGKGNIAVGRQPMQLTPYTLKMIDIDTYFADPKTDSGNYPLDAFTAALTLGGVNLSGFAAKTDEFSMLGAGLISQPTGGLYETFSPFYTNAAGALVAGSGAAAGGLGTTSQTAGVRATFGTPYNGNLGLTFLEAAGAGASGYNTVNVYGADAIFQFGKLNFGANWAQTVTFDGNDVLPSIHGANQALDGKLGFVSGKLGADAGYRYIGNNFGAPGYWSKIGRWANPTNVKGPYLDATYGIQPNLKFVLDGAFYNGTHNVAALPGVINSTDDDLWTVKAGVKWGLGSTNSLNLGYEFIQWSPTGAGNGTSNESYLTIGWAYQVNPDAGVSLGYQIVDYSAAAAGDAPYGNTDYKGGVAVAQFKAQF